MGMVGLICLVYLYNTLFGGPSSPPPTTTSTPVVATTSSANKPSSETARPSVPGGASPGVAAIKLASTSSSLDPTLDESAMLRTEGLVYSGTGRNIFSATYTPPPVAIVKPKFTPRPLPPPPTRSNRPSATTSASADQPQVLRHRAARQGRQDTGLPLAGRRRLSRLAGRHRLPQVQDRQHLSQQHPGNRPAEQQHPNPAPANELSVPVHQFVISTGAQRSGETPVLVLLQSCIIWVPRASRTRVSKHMLPSFSANGAAISQPRAKPWVTWRARTEGCKPGIKCPKRPYHLRSANICSSRR